MSDVTTIVVENGETRILVGEQTAAAAAFAGQAVEARDAALAAADAFTIEFGAFVKAAEGVAEGRYFAGFSLPFDLAVSGFFGQVLTGTGSCQVSIADDTLALIGPLAVGVGGTSATPSLTIPAGTNLFVQIDAVSGTIEEIAARITGVPA